MQLDNAIIPIREVTKMMLNRTQQPLTLDMVRNYAPSAEGNVDTPITAQRLTSNP